MMKNIEKNFIQKRKEFGNEFLYEELKKVDPESADKMLPQNWKRVMRALEVFHTTGATNLEASSKTIVIKRKKIFIQTVWFELGKKNSL